MPNNQIAAALPEWQWKWLTSYKLNSLRTQLHSLLHPSNDPRLVFIFGCQRSGTTMLRNFIGFHPAIHDHGEGDPPYFWQVSVEDPRYLRLVPEAEIERLTANQKSPLVLLKPLHDSQRAAELLRRFPHSKGLWIFRHYREVILSHLNYYKGRYDPLTYLKDLLELNTQSWKAEGLDESMRDFIGQHRLQASTPTAAFALFWLARNSLLFLENHPDLLTVNYTDLIAHPQQAITMISHHIQLNLDPRYALFPQRRERPQSLSDSIPESILTACDAMYEKLCAMSSNLYQLPK
jgi:hypothetical protein